MIISIHQVWATSRILMVVNKSDCYMIYLLLVAQQCGGRLFPCGHSTAALWVSITAAD